jgi:hypothetical protein
MTLVIPQKHITYAKKLISGKSPTPHPDFLGSGIDKSVYALDKNWVVKLGYVTGEFKNITQRIKYPAFRPFLPATHIVRCNHSTALIQERADPNDRLYDQHYFILEQLATLMGIDDIHEENVGFRKDKTPVFIDIGYAFKIPKIKKVIIPKWAKQFFKM